MSERPDEPIRVLRVIARLNVGGPALHVSYLTNGLEERGYETTLVAGSIGAGEGSMDYVARELGVQPVYVPALQREIGLGLERRAVGALLDLIRSFRPHVMHTHTAKAGAIGRIAAALAGRDRPPVVVHTFHGHVLRGYFGRGRTVGFRLIEHALARGSDALIAVSPEVRDDLVALGVAPVSKISVIRLGLDLERRTRCRPGEGVALRRDLGIPRDRFLVAWLGRMTHIKRTEDLIDAVARARARGADIGLLLVGDGPLRAELKSRVVAARLEETSHFLGFREDVAAIYDAADAVALTSANEGTPVTVIEALAAGRPVVATDVGGVPDVVEDGVTGHLVPAGDIDAITAGLTRLEADRQRAAAMGEAGRRRVFDRYAVPRLIGDIDTLYRSLLESCDPTRGRTYGGLGRSLVPAIPGLPPFAERRRDRPLRVVLVSQYFSPEIGATQSRMQAFADHLAARGHDVTVVCEFPNHPHGVVPDRYRGRLVEDDRSNAYRVLRVAVLVTPEKTQRTRMAFYLSYMAMAIAAAPRLGRADVIVATSPPLFAAAAGAVLARLMRAPFVLDVRDLWPAAAASLNQLSNPVALRGSQVVEAGLYRWADTVTAVTRPFCTHIDMVRDRPPTAIFLPNGTLPQFLEASPDGGREALGVDDDRFLATFAGNLGIAQALPTILDAADRSRAEVDYALVGEGPIGESLRAEAAARQLGNVHFHPQVPLEEVASLLAASDALLVTLAGHPTFAGFVPSKMVDFMATGRPLVLSAAGEPARILEDAGAGIAVPPEDADALAESLRWLRANPDAARQMGERGRRYARRHLRATQAERLEAVLVDVVKRSG